jgi:hypothetical protein
VKLTTDFCWRMETILDLYAEPPDPRRPLLCFDELAVSLVGDKVEPLPLEPGRPLRYDYEYRRGGKANVLMVFDPHRCWRKAFIYRQRTRLEFAAVMRAVVEEHYPEAEQLQVVLDNLNTHHAGSFYAAYDPETAAGLRRKIAFHYTPNHASWLNMIEIEFSVLRRQGLRPRLGSLEVLREQVAVWEAERNAAGATVEWRFGVAEARVKLKRFYDMVSV